MKRREVRSPSSKLPLFQSSLRCQSHPPYQSHPPLPQNPPPPSPPVTPLPLPPSPVTFAGNFVIYKAGSSAVWSTFTGTGIPASVRVILTTTG